MKIVETHTEKIYVDEERRLEFLTVGDYNYKVMREERIRKHERLFRE